MPGAQIRTSSVGRSQRGLHLLPWAVIMGAEAPQYDDRLQGAQIALNRIQVWLGDIIINLRRRGKAGAGSDSLDHWSEEGHKADSA
jgi:hypothetical protein